jgi:DNA-binding NarL/FixJ family response regulator
MSIRVMLVDDQPIVLRGLRAILQSESDIELVGEALDGQQAVEKAKELQPNILLMDMVMNGQDGAAATKIIVTQHPHIRVLVLTAHTDQETFRKAAEAGAAGYILKDIEPHNLCRAIRTVHAGRTMVSPTVSQQILHYFSMKQPFKISAAAGLYALTEREVDVLAALVDGLSDKQIGRRLFLSESTVKTHLRSIYRRLHVRNRAQAVAVAVEQKLLDIAR